MIVTKQKPLENILSQLEGKSKIFIVGCGDCATTCQTGSEEAVKKMSEQLAASGKQVVGWAIPDAPCVAAQIKTVLAKNVKLVKEAEAFLVLACGSGIQSVKEADRRGISTIGGCDTLFAATVYAKGNFQERCSACGECILEFTGGICPVTRCGKGLLNGPCGGVREGKCEVNRDRDCAWVLIHDELKKSGKDNLLKKNMPPKDFSKSEKPHNLNIEVK